MDDDLTARIGEILGDPASMEKLKGLAAMFGGGNPEPAKAQTGASAPPARQGEPRPSPAAGLDPELMRSVMKLAPALSGMKQDDDSTRLLRALRPLLGEKRRKKLDEAIRLMQLVRMIPYLKNTGLFQS
jgi:hypothetical protein